MSREKGEGRREKGEGRREKGEDTSSLCREVIVCILEMQGGTPAHWPDPRV